jgi:predicted nucleotidyltransferase
MKVREIITLECWVYGSGRSWQDTYADNIVEIKESELPKTADEYDWSWYDLPEERPEDSGEDINIIVEFYAEDAEPGYDDPLVKISKRESDLWEDRNA